MRGRHGDAVGQDAGRAPCIGAHRRIDIRLAVGGGHAGGARDQAATASKRAGQIGVVAVCQHRQTAHHLRVSRAAGIHAAKIVADARRSAGVGAGIGQRRTQGKPTHGDAGRFGALACGAVGRHVEVAAITNDHVVADPGDGLAVVTGRRTGGIGREIDTAGTGSGLGVHAIATGQRTTARCGHADVAIAAHIDAITQRGLQRRRCLCIHHHRAYRCAGRHSHTQTGRTHGCIGAGRHLQRRTIPLRIARIATAYGDDRRTVADIGIHCTAVLGQHHHRIERSGQSARRTDAVGGDATAMQRVDPHLVEARERAVGAHRGRYGRITRHMRDHRAGGQCTSRCAGRIDASAVLVRRRDVESAALAIGIDAAGYRCGGGLAQIVPRHSRTQAHQACRAGHCVHRRTGLVIAAATACRDRDVARIDRAAVNPRRGLAKQAAVSHRTACAQATGGNRTGGVAGVQLGLRVHINAVRIHTRALDGRDHLILLATQRQQTVGRCTVELRKVAAVQLAGQCRIAGHA
ncbi:hypothetical protein D3C81_754650 [compost metagenome]